MKNKFQSFEDGMKMAGGSIQHPLSIHSASIGTCRRHRVWQVLMTLVFLFTLSIGQMWAADPQDTYYKFTATASAGATIAPVSGDGGNITLGSNSAAKITAQNAWYTGVTYTHAININSSDAKSFSLNISGTAENPAHVFVLVTSDNRVLKLKYDGADVDQCSVRGTAGVSSYTAAASLVELVTTNTGSHVVYASGSAFVYAVRVVYEKNDLWQEIKGLSDATLDKDKTLADDLSTLYFFRMQDLCFNTDGVISFGNTVSTLRYSINFKAQKAGTVTINYANPGGSTRTLKVTEFTRPSTAGTGLVSKNVPSGTTSYSDQEFDVESGKEYVISFGSGATIKSVHFAAAAPPCTNLDAPTGLSCTAQTANTLTFGWTKETNAVGYVAKLYSDSGCETEVDSKDLGDVNTVTFTGLSNSTTYYCKVQSKGDGTIYCAEGGVTAAANGTTETPTCGVVTAPTSLLVGATTADGASFTIIDDADAFNYEFYVSESSTEPESSATATHTSTEKTKDVTGLTSGTTYYAWVRSVCDADHKSTWTAANKSFKVRTTPTASFADATYIIGASAINVADNFTSNSGASVVYELKESYPNVTLSGSSFSATAAGEYVVVANQAGNADYTPISKEATITVLDNELSDIFIFSKKADYGGDTKCISATQANSDDPTHLYVNVAYEGFTKMGRAATANTECVLTFTVKDTYESLFGIKGICTFGKFEEPAGGQISWDGGTNWEDLAKYTDSKKEFNAPAATYPTSFKIRFLGVKTDEGGLWWRNALVTLEVKKTVTGVTEALVGAEINGEAISSENLATLLADKTLNISTAYAAAPTVTFKKQVTTSYAGGWPADVENVDVEVTASDNTTAWQASATINSQTYTVTLAKPAGPSLETEATAFTLTSAKVATDTKKFTFSGMNLTSGNVTIVLESAVAGMTVTPAEVTPTAGVITDQEVTITYKSLEDVAEANVNLVVYYDADTKIVLPLTYSSTKGYEDLTSISAATTWNWDGAADAAVGTVVDKTQMIIFANADATWDEGFNARAIAGKMEHMYRDGKYAQGDELKFHTTIQGKVEVTYSNTGGNAARTVNVNGVKGTLSSTNNKEEDKRTESFNVSAGDVLIKGVQVSDDAAKYLRYYEVSFVPTYTVTYMPNGATTALEYIIDDNATAVMDCPAQFVAPEGKMFHGWNTAADGTGDAYAPSAAVTSDLALYAQWGAIMVAKIGETMYPSLEAALAHAADGEIVLLQNIDVTAQVEIADGVSATIDLAGYKIEYTGASTLSSGVILVHNGGSLTINDSSDPDAGSVVAGEKAYAALALTKAGDDASKPATLTINGGIFTGTYYAITGHGSRHNTVTTINGGTFTATEANDNLAIYHPQNGTLTINDGSFTGYLSAIEMRAGTLVINGGSFTATAPTFSCNAAGSGTTTQGAAIAIAQHTTKKDISVTINGGTFTGVKALNESNPQENDPAPQVTMAVTGGNFTGEVSTADVNKFISGGTFNHPVLEDQCAEGYMPKDNGGGSYGVQYAGVIRGAAVKETIGEDEIPMYTLDNGVKIYSSGSNGQVSTSSNFSTGSDVEVCGGDAGKYAFTSQHMILKFPKNVSGFKIFGTGSTQRSINKVYSNPTAGTSVQIKNVGTEHTGTFTGDKEQTGGKWCQYVEAVFDANNTIAKDEYVYVNLNGSMYAYRVIFTEAECTTPTVTLADKSAYAGSEVTLTAEASALGASYTWYRCDDASGANPQLLDETTASYTFTKAAGNEYFKVVVACNCSGETAEDVATVAERADVTLQDVTGSITWDWQYAGGDVNKGSSTSGVMANESAITNDDTFKSDALWYEGQRPNYASAKAAQVYKLMFHTTVPGVVAVEFANTGSSDRPYRELYINGSATGAKSKNTTHVTYSVVVPSGDVELSAILYDNDGNPTSTATTLNFYKVIFTAREDLNPAEAEASTLSGYERDVTEGRYGTICLPTAGIMAGASIYELAYYDATQEKIFMDEVLNGVMVADRPYVFLPNENVNHIGVYYLEEERAEVEAGNYRGLFGTYVDLSSENTTESPLWDNYILSANRYIHVTGSNCTLKKNRAYIKLEGDGKVPTTAPTLAPGRRRIGLGVQGEQVVTGIDNLNAGETPVKVMIDGQMYILRGEKMYDATGRLVK